MIMMRLNVKILAMPSAKPSNIDSTPSLSSHPQSAFMVLVGGCVHHWLLSASTVRPACVGCQRNGPDSSSRGNYLRRHSASIGKYSSAR